MEQVAGSQAAIQGYGETLAHWATRLGDETTVAALVKAVATLSEETRRAGERNRALEQQLSSSLARIARLRQNLAEAKQEVTTDPLTGIANRKAFEARLRRAITQARSERGALSVLLLDIDHFKRFNDQHGHRTGDLVLRLVGRVLSDNVKGRDCAARYGGEEFAILLVGATLQAGAVVAQQICDALSAKHLVSRGSGRDLGRVTVSVGVAELQGQESAAALVERADLALYEAKRTGRNRVCVDATPAEPEPRAPGPIAMPFETRQIVFRTPEVAQAVTEWHRRMRTPLPAGTVVRCAADGDGPDDAPRVRMVIALDDLEAVHLGGSHREVVIEGPALAAALILYCSDRRIPLPASAKKSLRRVGEQVGLVVTSGLTGARWRGW